MSSQAAPVKYKKKSIPKVVKDLSWNTWIGEDVAKAKCMCCEVNQIKMSSFHCGHIIADSNGGTTSVNNLKPICAACNLSMGTENMDDFKKRCGFGIALATPIQSIAATATCGNTASRESSILSNVLNRREDKGSARANALLLAQRRALEKSLASSDASRSFAPLTHTTDIHTQLNSILPEPTVECSIKKAEVKEKKVRVVKPKIIKQSQEDIDKAKITQLLITRKLKLCPGTEKGYQHIGDIFHSSKCSNDLWWKHCNKCNNHFHTQLDTVYVCPCISL